MKFALMRTRTDRARTRPWINSALHKGADEAGGRRGERAKLCRKQHVARRVKFERSRGIKI